MIKKTLLAGRFGGGVVRWLNIFNYINHEKH